MNREKDVEELAGFLDKMIGNSSHLKAEKIYNAGWRKQSEAIWESDDAYSRFRKHFHCSACGYYVERMQNFCPNCGAKMKGGAK